MVLAVGMQASGGEISAIFLSFGACPLFAGQEVFTGTIVALLLWE